MILHLWIILSLIILVEGILTTKKTRSFRDYFLRKLHPRQAGSFPKVAVLAPCKGLEEGLKENIESWLGQEYPDFRIFFIVDSADDPAYPLINAIPGADVFVAGKAKACGQKVHNLLFGASKIPEEYEAFAFVDSDCRLKHDWLSSLMHALKEHPDDAVTAYRWFPREPGFGPVLRAVWNSSVLTLFRESGENFAWGGSMALFRKTFFETDVPAYWAGSLSDDYGLMRAMRGASRKIHFVPAAMALTSGPISVFEFIRWALRQLFITRIYHPSLWQAGLLFHSIWFVWLIWGICFFPISLLWLFLLSQILQAMKAETRLQCVRVVFPTIDAGNRLVFWILSPLIALVNFALLWRSAFMGSVRWRGMKYEVENATRLRVLEY